MSKEEVLNLNSEDLEGVSGGKTNDKRGLSGAIWKPICPGCGKVMPGGEGVIRIHKEGAKSPYFCTECAEKLLNKGEAVIDPGYENLYEKYEKSKNETTGDIWYGWRKIKD